MNRIAQVKILVGITEFKVKQYWRLTILPTLLVSIITIPQIYLRRFFGQEIVDVILFSVLSFTLIALSVYIVGLSKDERYTIHHQLKKAIIRNSKS